MAKSIGFWTASDLLFFWSGSGRTVATLLLGFRMRRLANCFSTHNLFSNVFGSAFL